MMVLMIKPRKKKVPIHTKAVRARNPVKNNPLRNAYAKKERANTPMAIAA